MVTIFANAAERMGVNGKEAKRFIKFLVVGAIGFIVDVGTFNLLRSPISKALSQGAWLDEFLISLGLSASWVEGTLPAVLTSTLSFLAAICSNFLWNRYWTYLDSRSKPIVQQFIQFFVVSVTGLALRVPIMSLTHSSFLHLVETFFPDMAVARVELIGDNLTLALSVLIVLFWNFFINRYWTYSDVDKQVESAAS